MYQVLSELPEYLMLTYLALKVRRQFCVQSYFRI